MRPMAVTVRGQAALAGEQVSARARDVRGQPLAVRERDHPVLVSLPDGDSEGRRRDAHEEAPVTGERQVIVSPAGDAFTHGGTEGAGDEAGELPRERGLAGG